MNDLKLLYDKASIKDELTQLSEKLNIEENGLPAILNGLLDMIADIPAPPETVTFDLRNFEPSSGTEYILPEELAVAIHSALSSGKEVIFQLVNGYAKALSYGNNAHDSGQICFIFVGVIWKIMID